MKRILLLGASGNVAPHVIPGLEPHYDLRLADIKPHPDGKPITHVDVTDYAQVADATSGMDAILNFTVLRDHPTQSFMVSTRGTWHMMRAAKEHGLEKVVHTGPQTVRSAYDYDFDIVDAPRAPGTGYYCCTKMLGMEIAAVYARAYRIHTVSFMFNGLFASPTERIEKEDFPPFVIVWEDLQLACRQALEVEAVPDYFQAFNMLSYTGHGKYSVEKARRMLGYEPQADWERYYRRDDDSLPG